MIFDLTANKLFGYDAEKSPVKMSEKLANTLDGLMSFPLNIPGTAYHKCLKVIQNDEKKINFLGKRICLRLFRYVLF